MAIATKEWQTTNAVTASAFFIGALVSDAMTAREVKTDVPASLRGTGLTLVCLFAAPTIIRHEIGIYGWLQRPVIGLLLLASALVGLHEGGAMTRAFDAIFITVVGVIVVGLYSLGGMDEVAKSSGDANKQDRAVSTSSCMLAGSLMLYSNLRILRAGMRHSIEVRHFGVPISNSTDFVRGYAHASDLASVSVTFGGALGIGAALVMVAHVRKLAEGTGAISLQLGVAGVFQLLAAFAASISTGLQVTHLPALYSGSACLGDAESCRSALMSRRFSLTNTQNAGLWLSSIGMLALAYPPTVRLTTRADVARYQWSFTGLVFSVFAVVLAFLILWSNFAFNNYVEYVLVLLLIAVIWSSYIDTWSGGFFYLAAFIWDEAMYINEVGIDRALTHATHVSLFFNAFLLLVHTLLVAFRYSFPSRELELFTGATAVAGSSVAAGLFTASACLVMGYGGSIEATYKMDDGPRDSATFVFQHFAPLLVWAPIFTCRCEVNMLSKGVRAVIWLLAVPLVVAVYATVLAAISSGPPAVSFFDEWALPGSLIGAGVLPWAAASIV
tara:strand:+ start:1664 stop:3331 length:1668 start_codon:yes stop_codon:yes gene_type:complete